MTTNESPILRVKYSLQDQEAPPIPPRKSMNVSSELNRPPPTNITLKPQAALPEPDKVERSPTPDQKPKSNFLAQNGAFDDVDEDEDPICGPAETISGEFPYTIKVNL